MARNRNQRAARRLAEQLERRVRILEENFGESTAAESAATAAFRSVAANALKFGTAGMDVRSIHPSDMFKPPTIGHVARFKQRALLLWINVLRPAVSVAIGMTLAGLILYALKL